MSNVSVFGLGKIGHTLACCLVAAGNRVIGYDPIDAVVDAVNRGTHTTGEPGTAERLASAPFGALSATSNPEGAIINSDVSMVVVPTPSNTLGGFSLRYVLEASRQIAEALRKKESYHIVAIVSTVLPGASHQFIIPELEAVSGRALGRGFGYCYNPSFIALGEVVTGFEKPDYVLIGEADSNSGDPIERVHRSMLRSDTPVARMKPIEAEIAKIASNTHETMRVAFANMLFSICSEVPNADVDQITGALAHRMGQRFFKGAVPYGGPCWPRDNRALSVFMDAIGVPSLVPQTIDVSNGEHGRYVLRKVLAATERGDTVGLLGLSYKPGTQVIDASFGISLAEWLVSDGRQVIAWDPLAMTEARSCLNGRISYATTAEDCLRAASVVMIVNPMKELASLDWAPARKTVVMDPWRCLSEAAIAEIGTYVPMGRGNGYDIADWPNGDLTQRLRLLNS